MLYHPQRQYRGGAAMLEAAIVLPVFLTLVLGMIDMAFCVFRFNTLSDGARIGARLAILHGPLSKYTDSPWDEATAQAAIYNRIKPLLPGLQPSGVVVTYPSGNALEQPVTVQVAYSYTPMIGYILGGRSITLTAASTMNIHH